MLFTNISADKIQFINEWRETLIEHGDLEKTIADFLYQQKNISQIFMINWPGSFTNLRIATLAFNMYNFLHNGVADFYSIDKLSLYQKLYQQNILPRHGYIFIGQRKNRRKVDLETMQHELVQEFSDSDAFMDEVFDGEQRDNMIHLGRKEWKLLINYKWKQKEISIEELWLEAVKTVDANYMMQPNVTIKEFT